MHKITRYISAGADNGPVAGEVALTHDQRHLRRKVLKLANGDSVMLDLNEAVLFANGDRLVLDNDDRIEITAKPEELFEVQARDGLHLIQLAWHLGNRHLPAQIEEARILILRDHVIRQMLEGLGASVCDVVEPFHPVRGAYHANNGHVSHSHSHSHSHAHGDHHGLD